MPETILIVEDHDVVRMALRRWLEATLPEYFIAEVPRAEDAIALVRANPPRIIIMDISLSGMNGIEATRRIKEAAPSVHVVILTIHEDDAYRADAAAAGASAYIPKRRTQSELLSTLTGLLAGATATKQGETILNNGAT
jgi:DNA-binding NarL/FixJ family response regulator